MQQCHSIPHCYASLPNLTDFTEDRLKDLKLKLASIDLGLGLSLTSELCCLATTDPLTPVGVSSPCEEPVEDCSPAKSLGESGEVGEAPVIRDADVRLARIISMIMPLQSQQMLIWGPVHRNTTMSRVDKGMLNLKTNH